MKKIGEGGEKRFSKFECGGKIKINHAAYAAHGVAGRAGQNEPFTLKSFKNLQRLRREQ